MALTSSSNAIPKNLAPASPFSPTFFLATATILLMAALSPSALVYFGVNYVLPGGNPLQKFHPGTYLAVASLCFLYATGHANRLIHVATAETREVFYFTAGIFALAFYVTAFKDVPFSGTLDTFLTAIFVFLLIALLTTQQRGMLGHVLDVFMLLNSLLGIYEAGTNWRLVPFSVGSLVLGQILYPYEWRASAFFGHPLTNAYLTGAYALSLLVTNRVPSLYIKLPLFMIHAVALLAFGSRAAMALMALFGFFFIIKHLLSGLLGGRMNRTAGAFLIGLVPLVFVGAPVLLGSGFADRFIDRFANDRGSAETRLSALDMVASYSFSSLMFGPSEMESAQVATRFGTQFGVESFYLSYLFRFGVLGCLMFFPGLYLFCRGVARSGGPGVGYLLIYFFACCGTSVSISSKNLSFAILVAICLTCGNAGAIHKQPQIKRRVRLA